MTGVEALLAALAVEHQTVYGYGVAGAHLAGGERRRARAAYDRHRLRRDQLATLLTLAKVSPPAAAPAYSLPFTVADAVAARALLARLEDACAGAAWDVTAASAGGSDARRVAVPWLAEAAAAAAEWRGRGTPVVSLPGRPGS